MGCTGGWGGNSRGGFGTRCLASAADRRPRRRVSTATHRSREDLRRYAERAAVARSNRQFSSRASGTQGEAEVVGDQAGREPRPPFLTSAWRRADGLIPARRRPRILRVRRSSSMPRQRSHSSALCLAAHSSSAESLPATSSSSATRPPWRARRRLRTTPWCPRSRPSATRTIAA
jgi:hypothetical protein